MRKHVLDPIALGPVPPLAVRFSIESVSDPGVPDSAYLICLAGVEFPLGVVPA